MSPQQAALRLPQELASTLVRWQRAHGRHSLPWQQTRNPYRVWLSEIMLQQTQVSTVLTYYERFLQRFPNVEALGQAPLDEVLALWAGLGYYSRARNLHRCAQVVLSEHAGQFPRSREALEALPGIGRSTAAAIAAFCFDAREAILDGNVKRVLTRVAAFGDDLAQRRHELTLWQMAQDALPPASDMVAYTQGLMDLGASLCSQRAPQCAACPLSSMCRAQALGQQAEFPVKTRKLKRRRWDHAWLCLQTEQGVWLVQRPSEGVWAGLWSLPEFDSVESAQAALAWPQGEWAIWPAFKHVLTHADWWLTPIFWRGQMDDATQHRLKQQWPQGRWVAWREIDQLGLPAPLKKLLLGGHRAPGVA